MLGSEGRCWCPGLCPGAGRMVSAAEIRKATGKAGVGRAEGKLGISFGTYLIIYHFSCSLFQLIEIALLDYFPSAFENFI